MQGQPLQAELVGTAPELGYAAVAITVSLSLSRSFAFFGALVRFRSGPKLWEINMRMGQIRTMRERMSRHAFPPLAFATLFIQGLADGALLVAHPLAPQV